MENIRTFQRIRHAQEPDMFGTVIARGEEGMFLVSWDGGVSQWMYASQLATLGGVPFETR